MIPQPFPIRMLMLATRKWNVQTIVISHAVAEFATHHFHIPANQITVLHNGIDLPAFQSKPENSHIAALRNAWGIPSGAKILMMAGRLHSVKGHKDAIDTIRSLQDLGVWLVIVGDGPEEQYLRTYAQGLPVVFTGQRSDIPDLLGMADLVLMPSKSEGLGLSAMEALAAGTPVIAYATGGLTEIINNNKTGILVPTGNVPALGAAARSILTNPHRRESMSDAARLHAQSFSIDDHVEKLLKLYRNMSKSNPIQTNAKHAPNTFRNNA